MQIEWRVNSIDDNERISACGNYKIRRQLIGNAKRATGYAYVPYVLTRTKNSAGMTFESWDEIEKPKKSYDEAKEICEKFAENNNKTGIK